MDAAPATADNPFRLRRVTSAGHAAYAPSRFGVTGHPEDPLARASVITCLAVLTLLTSVAASDDWPQFRGRTAGAVADDPSLPDTWSLTENVVWNVEVPGRGWSSPIVWGDTIVLTATIREGGSTDAPRGLGGVSAGSDAAAHRWVVHAFDFGTGKIRWTRELRQFAPPDRKHAKNSFASATPVTDGHRIYVFFPVLGLTALDFEGRVLWTVETPKAQNRVGWGAGASPALHEDRVFITHGGEQASFLAAHDAATGRERWRVDLPVNTPYSTPYVWSHAQRTEVVLATTDKVRSFDLEGKLLWELKGMTWIAIPTPFARHDLLYVTSGFPGDSTRPAYAIRPGASGDITLKEGETANQWIAWSQPLVGPYNTSPLVYGDYYYTLLDRGFLLCHDAKTGKPIYERQRVAFDASGFTASPWAYNGKIFALSEDGETYVIQAGPQFKVLGKNPLIDETTLATPAIARGSLFIRTATRLFRISRAKRP
jgi:outer membrane protein assembly factor BamB